MKTTPSVDGMPMKEESACGKCGNKSNRLAVEWNSGALCLGCFDEIRVGMDEQKDPDLRKVVLRISQ